MTNALNWFEIAVTDIERAKRFYETVLAKDLTPMNEMPGFSMYMFPTDGEGSVGGGIVHGDGYTPGTTGSIVYLNAQPDLSGPLSRVADAGGTVLQEKTAIGENGFIAFITDTEGNRVGLHSMG